MIFFFWGVLLLLTSHTCFLACVARPMGKKEKGILVLFKSCPSHHATRIWHDSPCLWLRYRNDGEKKTGYEFLYHYIRNYTTED